MKMAQWEKLQLSDDNSHIFYIVRRISHAIYTGISRYLHPSLSLVIRTVRVYLAHNVTADPSFLPVHAQSVYMRCTHNCSRQSNHVYRLYPWSDYFSVLRVKTYHLYAYWSAETRMANV